MRVMRAAFWVVVAVVALPVVLNPAALPTAALLVGVLLVARWVLREWLDLKKSREFGRASQHNPLDLADRDTLNDRMDGTRSGNDGDSE
ncbi:hypothetical protein C478_07302 [Natrinema thermotolerans DSM 11552]|nr:hypothetical protein C478_07302 [Natrinema thermotolerans DSM 11552]